MEVENALLKRAKGFEYEETTTEIFEFPDGTTRKHIKKTKKYYPPDTGAAYIWLKNRLPDKWRDNRMTDYQRDHLQIDRERLELDRLKVEMRIDSDMESDDRPIIIDERPEPEVSDEEPS